MEETQESEIANTLANSEPLEIGPLVTEVDKEKFFKSVIADKPFEDTIPMFDGKLHITLKTIFPNEIQPNHPRNV